MGISSMWEVRATVMRKEFKDVIAKAPGAEVPARFAFLSNVTQTHGAMLRLYSAASPSERRAILRCAKKAATGMWLQGAWPWALGLQISCLNVESRFLSGADAAYVRAETDKIIEEAVRTQSVHHVKRPAPGWWLREDVDRLCDRSVRHLGRAGRSLHQLAVEARHKQAALLVKIAVGTSFNERRLTEEPPYSSPRGAPTFDRKRPGRL